LGISTGCREDIGATVEKLQRTILPDTCPSIGEILHQERKSFRQRELLLQTALDSSPMAFVLVNQLERVLYANVKAAPTAGRRKGPGPGPGPVELRYREVVF